MQELRFRFRWPAAGPRGEYDNFFFGIWHPAATLAVDVPRDAPVPHASVAGRNWLLASAVSGVHTGAPGLVHVDPADAGGVAFRGYVLEPAVHCYSPPARILDYWRREPLAQHNGVYSAAVVGAGGETLVLTADLFGISALYYARIGSALIFSTNPRYLVTRDPAPDRLAWRCLLETGFIAADRSLSEGVQRLPAGKALCASRSGADLVTQFDFERLPAGTRSLDAGGIRQVEDLFQETMRRCIALGAGELILPLSSGHDSRRMLASLIDRRLGFQAVTCRVFHRGRDLDAKYAAEMARDFAFPHAVVERPAPREYVGLDLARRRLLDGESFSHTWALALNAALPPRPSLLFDGLAGDILGNPGFRIPTLYRSPREDIEIILEASVRGAFARVLDGARWPGAAAVSELLRAYLEALPPRINLAEFAFILLRIRRSTALQTLPLIPPGCLAVFPFLDLDYVRLLFEFVPADKHRTVLQRKCLAEFWPQYHRYPGTRDIPQELAPRADEVDAEATRLCFAALLEAIGSHDGLRAMRRLLSPRGLAGFEGARRSRALARRANWYCSPLLELLARELERRPCWEGPG